MSAKIIDGKVVAAKWHAEVLEGAERLKAETGVVPGLGVILVGDNPASISYVTAKEKACEADGLLSREIRLSAEATEADVLAEIGKLNEDPAIHGILVQLPLPKHIREKAVIDAILPEKDVDGFTDVNVGRMVIGAECFLPCTPNGIVQLLAESGVETSGKHAVVVGRSNIVGKPVANLLMSKGAGRNATVTVCHTGTKNLADYTKTADILIVASGVPQTVTGEMIQPGAVVIDVGVNRISDATTKRGYRLVGDVDFASAAEVAGMITPVPGGVGPLTIAMLMENTLEAARRAVEKARK